MPFRKKKVEEVAVKAAEVVAPKKAATKRKKKVAAPVVNCRCDELEARIVGLESKSNLISRLRDAVNGLLLQQANGRKKNIRKV
tara:strand:+ start:125 stop:376 length:252 start_codon:yes stop_codon:yes gene_type:complete